MTAAATLVPDAGRLVFNVIYVPGSFDVLGWMLLSLAEHADCRFRIVANGCGDAEWAQMQSFAARNPRFEACRLPWSRVATHGRALDHLFAAEDGQYFAFMDSDILATGPWLKPILDAVRTAPAVSTGWPLWVERDEARLDGQDYGATGIHAETDSGQVLGLSYLAVYQRAALAAVRTRHSLDFERRSWEELPRRLRRALKADGLPLGFFDTAKLLNIMLGSGVVLPGDGLIHVGSASVVRSADFDSLPAHGLRFRIADRALDWLERVGVLRPLACRHADRSEARRPLIRERWRVDLKRELADWLMSAQVGRTLPQSEAQRRGLQDQRSIIHSRALRRHTYADRKHRNL